MVLKQQMLTARSRMELRKAVDWCHSGRALTVAVQMMAAGTGESTIDCRDTILDVYLREKPEHEKTKLDARNAKLKAAAELVRDGATVDEVIALLKEDGVAVTKEEVEEAVKAMTKTPDLPPVDVPPVDVPPVEQPPVETPPAESEPPKE
jgi:predicted nucleotidyltransferase